MISNEINITIEQEDCNKLHKLHNKIEAEMNLLSRLLLEDIDSFNKLFLIYSEDYSEYATMKDYITKKYSPSEYTNSSIDYGWTADFNNCVVTFYATEIN